MKKILLSILTGMIGYCFICHSVYSAPPTRLMTDLIEYTERVWTNGYPSQLSIDYVGKVIEPMQRVLIFTQQPQFGWQVNDTREDVIQTAWRIQVASSRELLETGVADMWDSGRQSGSNSTSQRYRGRDLCPSTIYYWRVMTWNNGDAQDWSAVKAFQTTDTLVKYKTPYYPLEKTVQTVGKSVQQISEDIVLVDFGRAAFGQICLTLTSKQRGDTVTVRLGECLRNSRIDPNPGGSRRFLNQRLALLSGTHTYYVKIPADSRNTASRAILMPSYVGEVYPFRYCEIEGKNIGKKLGSVSRETVQYPFDDQAAEFSCSDTILQQIWDLCKYSIKATTFAGIYVDGDRERIPYEADALINQLAHYCTDREFSLARRSHEYLLTHATWPTEWIMQSVIIAWNDYLYTGDKRSLEQNYELLKNKTLSALADDDGFIRTDRGRLTPELYKSICLEGQQLQNIVDWPKNERDGYVFTEVNTVVNAYHYYTLVLMSKIAEALEYLDEAKVYSRQAADFARKFNKKLFNKRTGTYRDGIGTEHQSIHGNMFPLAFGLTDSRQIPSVVQFIRSRGMACSVYGSQFLLDALYDAEAADYALELLTSKDKRSWYNMLRAGSTITFEAWDNQYKSNQDWNHAWGAAPANLIPRKLMGIEPILPGFEKIRIKPQPAALEEASIKLPTIRGDVQADFLNQPEQFCLHIDIPANVLADVYLPLPSGVKQYVLTLNNKPVVSMLREGKFVKIPSVGSGSKYFVIKYLDIDVEH